MNVELSNNDGAKMAEFFSDFSKAQAEINNVLADKQGYSNKYSYAELYQVLGAIKEPFSKYGLSLSQFPSSTRNEDGVTTTSLTTMVFHKSGEWMKSTMCIDYPATAGMSAIQALGSHISYARRYMMASICGVAQVDNLDEIDPKEADPISKAERKKEEERILSEKAVNSVIDQINSSTEPKALRKLFGDSYRSANEDHKVKIKTAYDAKKLKEGWEIA